MADSSSSNGSPGANEQGVFANLPRTRPQRHSPRRAAARNSSSSSGSPARRRNSSSEAARNSSLAGEPAPAAKSAPARAKPAKATAKQSQAPSRRRPSTPSAARSSRTTAPRQGFESEGERGSRSLQPPGAADLVVSAAELVTELAKGGLSRGERLVRDLLSRRP
jgi:hypothetical protein